MRPSDFIPPIVVRAVRRVIPKPIESRVEGDYASFADALARCAEGYHAPAVVMQQAAAVRQTVAAPWVDGRTQQLLAAMRDLPAGPAVLDFGGGMGQHFRALREHLRPRRWVVCETEVMAAAARREFPSPDLEYVTSLADAPGPFDVVLASGVLQFVAEPYETLAALLARAPRLVVNRLGLIEAPRDRLVVFRSPAGPYPMWFLSRARFEAALAAAGAKLTMRWHVPEDVDVLEGQSIVSEGLVAAKEPVR